MNFFYAMTMWAIATRNFALEGLGRLQTGVVKRSINEYFLLKDGNTNHPPDFVKNKASSLLPACSALRQARAVAFQEHGALEDGLFGLRRIGLSVAARCLTMIVMCT